MSAFYFKAMFDDKEKLPDLSKAAIKTANPYDDRIRKYADASNLDEELVRRMATKESNNKQKARSWAGNQGLLQISDDVAKRFVKPEEFGTLDPTNLDVNLAGGTRYYKWLLDRYKGDHKRALAGYNAGEGNADKSDWWEKSVYWSNDKAVQQGLKPRGETDKTNTRNYIDKITEGYNGMGYKLPDLTSLTNLPDLSKAAVGNQQNELPQINAPIPTNPQTAPTPAVVPTIDDLVKNKMPFVDNTIVPNVPVQQPNLSLQSANIPPLKFDKYGNRVAAISGEEQPNISPAVPQTLPIETLGDVLTQPIAPEITEPQVSVNAFNRANEEIQRNSESGKRFQKFLTRTGQAETPESIKAFNDEQQSAAKRAALPQAAKQKIAGKTAPINEFQKSGKFKLGDIELTATDSFDLPDNQERVKDADGETYIVDKDKMTIADESLKEKAETIPVTLEPYKNRATVPPEMAKRLQAEEIADILAPKYKIARQDVINYVTEYGFTDLSTGGVLPDDRLYTDRLETSKTDDYTITRRQLGDLVKSARENQQKREDYVLDLLTKGQEVSTELYKELEINPDDLQNKRYDDYQMSLVKGKVAAEDFDKFTKANTAQGQDEVIAKINASAQVGRINRKKASELIGAYKNDLNNNKLSAFNEREAVRDELSSYNQKAQGYIAGAVPSVTDEQVDKEISLKNLAKLTEAEQQKGEFVGKNVNPFFAGIVGGSGRTMSAAAGILRPFASTGVLPSSWYEGLSKQGQIQQIAEQTNSEENTGITSSILRIGGGLASDIPRFILLSRIPGGTTVTFALDSGLQSAGRGETLEQISADTLKGAGIGLVFAGSSRLAGMATNAIARNIIPSKSLQKLFAGEISPTVENASTGASAIRTFLTNPSQNIRTGTGFVADEAGNVTNTVRGAATKNLLEGETMQFPFSKFADKTARLAFRNLLTAADVVTLASTDQAAKNALLAAKILGQGVRIGTVGAGIYGTEKLAGASDEKALNEAAKMVIFDLAMQGGGKLASGIKSLAGKIIRVKNGERFGDYVVQPDGVIKGYGKIDGELVDIVLDSSQSFRTAKNVTNQAKSQDRSDPQQKRIEGFTEGFQPFEPVQPKPTAPSGGNVITVKDLSGKIIESAIVPDAQIKTRINQFRTQYPEDSISLDSAEKLTKSGNSDERGNLLETSPEPKALSENVPMRMDYANPKDVENLQSSKHAPKIFEILQDGKTHTVEELAQATRYKSENVTDTVMTLYGARKVEILPDQSIRLISAEPIAPKPTNLYELAQTRKNPQPPINLGASSLSKQEQADIQNQNKRIAEESGLKSDIVSEKSQPNTVSQTQPTIEQQTAQKYSELPPQKQTEAKTEKQKAQVIYAERPNIAGKLNKVKTERGTSANINPKVIDASDILTSLDEGYPPEFQPRQRDTRQASKAQIADIANKLEPDFLGDSPKASDGRPLVVPVTWNGQTKYAVISGNGRTEGIRTAYALENEPSRKYADFARSKDADSATLKQPVYVGILDPNEIDLPEFAKEANESSVAKMSATEQAKSDAGYLNSGLLNNFHVADDGNINITPNRDFIRGFMESVAPSEQNALMMPDGSLSQEGINRVRNAIFAKAFGQSEKGLNAIQRMAESTDDNIKRITSALLSKAPAFASLKQAVEDGKRYPEFDITDNLATAIEKLSALRDSGTSIDEYISQGNLFGAETTPFQTRIIQVLDTYKRSPKAIKTILDDFLKTAEAAGDPQQSGLFGKSATIDEKAVLEGAVSAYETEQRRRAEEGQPGLFGTGNQGLPVQPGTSGKSGGLFADRQTEEPTAGSERESSLKFDGNEKPFLSIASGNFEPSPAQKLKYTKRPDLAAKLNRVKSANQTELNDQIQDFAKKDVSFSDLTAKAIFTATGDGEAAINLEAFRLIHKAFENIYGKTPLFFGAYLNPHQVNQVRAELKNIFNEFYPQLDRRAKLYTQKFLTNFNNRVSDYGDLILNVANGKNPLGLTSARQEERAHRADYRIGAKHSVGRGVMMKTREGRKSIINLGKGDYKNTAVEVRAVETTAKIFVEDGRTETGLTARETAKLQVDLLLALFDNGKTAAEIDEAFKDVSPIGAEFGKQAKEYERTNKLQRNSANNEQTESTGKEEFSANGESGQGTRTRERRTSFLDTPGQSANFGSGLLESTGNQSLVPANQPLLSRTGFDQKTPPKLDDTLFSIPPEMPTNAELTEEIESTTEKVLSYFYDGKRDVTVPEAIVNLIRAGILFSYKVVKNNATSNFITQITEQGVKPFAVTADRLNWKSKGRTVSGISPTAIFNGLFSRQGAFREGLFGSERGIYGALRYGVSEKESKRFDLQTDKRAENPQFVRNTGIPLLDVIIEASKRISAGGDRPFKSFARTSELPGLAKAFAKNDKSAGLVTDWKKRMREYQKNPTPLMLEMIENYAEITTFQNSNAALDAYAKVRRTLVNDKDLEKLIPNAATRKAARPILGLAYIGLSQIAPFVNTPVNVGMRSLEYFPPTGVVKAAWQFFQIGQSTERRAWLEDAVNKRNRKIERLEKLRNRDDKKYESETDRIEKGYHKKFEAKQKLFGAELEKVSLVTDKYRREHERMLIEKRKKIWNDGWQESFDKYQAQRINKKDEINKKRRDNDSEIQDKWAEENAAADLGFTFHENRRFAEAAGRMMFGTFVGGLLLLAIGYAALEAVGTTDYDDEKDKADAKRKAGIPNDTIKIGGYRFRYSNNGFGYALKMGVNLLEQWNRPGTSQEKATAAAKTFSKDLLKSNPLTQSTLDDFEHKDLGSDIGSRLAAPIPRILGEIGEITDDQPRKYWDEGFGAQFLIKLPNGREFLPASESYIGGLEERGDGWRRFLRLIDPVDTVRENQPQSTLPNTPLSKYSDPAPLKEKLKSADTGDVLKYYNQFKDRMKPEETTELLKLLKSKADNANEKGTLSDDEKIQIEKVFPDMKFKEKIPALPKLPKLKSQFDDER